MCGRPGVRAPRSPAPEAISALCWRVMSSSKARFTSSHEPSYASCAPRSWPKRSPRVEPTHTYDADRVLAASRDRQSNASTRFRELQLKFPVPVRVRRHTVQAPCVRGARGSGGTHAWKSVPARRHARAAGVNFSIWSRDATARGAVPLRPRRGRPAEPRGPARPGATAPTTTGTCTCPASSPGSSTAGASTARSTRPTATASTGRSCSSTRTPARWPCPASYDRGAARRRGDNAATAMKSRGGRPLPLRLGGRPRRSTARSSRTVIYEMHVKGFTLHPSSGVAEPRRGTYAGLVEKIPYLARPGRDRGGAPAGLPVRRRRTRRRRARQLLGLLAGLLLRAPRAPTPPPGSPLAALDEFRDMVKALHRAGIEVILDVVFNHTAEGGRARARPSASAGSTTAPTTSSTGTGPRYANFTGCGNTLKANHPVVRRLILDASATGSRRCTSTASASTSPRCSPATTDGQPAARARPSSGTSRATRCWPAPSSSPRPGTPPGSTRWGTCVGDSWKEWNGRFRDDVRSLPARRPGQGGAPRQPALRQPRPLRAEAARAGAERQLRHLPRRLHPERPRHLRTRSTTRRTGRGTATASTTSSPGTAAWRGRPTIRPWRRCGRGR